MGLAPAEAALLRVSKGDQKFLNALQEGVHIAGLLARPLPDLMQQATADRLALAESLKESGDKLLRLRPPHPRSAISRYYYAMYHAMRAVVYFVYEGDDHEQHSALPGKTPKDFVDAGIWQNALKDARGRRNEADYDPYPLAVADFSTTAKDLQAKTAQFLVEARAYLKSKGCNHL